MAKTYPVFKAAVVQAGPVFLDLDTTVQKTCDLIREAGRNGARLIGFPESFIPGFPSWVMRTGPMGRAATLYGDLYKNALEIPSRHVKTIADAAREAKTFVCISATERDGGSLYLCQLWFDDGGNIIGKHRKLRPTGPERYIWGDGDGSMMPVMDTEIGRLGGLLCWENMVPLTSAAMSSMNQQVHVASWPMAPFRGNSPFTGIEACRDLHYPFPLPQRHAILGTEIISRNYAMATQTFVLCATQVVTAATLDKLQGIAEPEEFQLGGGHSFIAGPDGEVLSDALPHDQEGLVYADIPLEMVIYAKYMCDPGGHYSVPNVLSLNFDRAAKPAVVAASVGAPSYAMRYDDIVEG